MSVYSAGSQVTVSFDLVDSEGNAVTPLSATYSVFGEDGEIIIDNAAISITGDENDLEVVITSAENALGTGEAYGARTVVLNVQGDGSQTQFTESYLLKQHVFLSVPNESGQTVLQAHILARQLGQSVLDAWDSEDDDRRRAALMEAWVRVSRYSFKPWAVSREAVSSDINSDLIDGLFRLSDLTTDEWGVLPAAFTQAVRRAQLIEACVILGGDPTWDRRADGLLSKTVGESSEMFNNRKVEDIAISPKAKTELAPFLNRTIRIGRG